jgi:hypothetical protein
MTRVITYYKVKQSTMTRVITYHTVKQSPMTRVITYHTVKQSPMTRVIFAALPEKEDTHFLCQVGRNCRQR